MPKEPKKSKTPKKKSAPKKKKAKQKKSTQDTRKMVSEQVKEAVINSATAILILSFVFGFAGGILGFFYAPMVLSEGALQNILPGVAGQQKQQEQINKLDPANIITQENAVIETVENATPSVVSVIATRDLPVIEEYYYNPFGELFPGFEIPQFRQRGTQEQQVSAGTCFVAAEGFIVTNRHVVSDVEAEYTIITADGESHEAEVIARDPVEDLAILRVEGLQLKPLPLADSSGLKTGQTVITIGNALGEFDNTVSVGVVSGLHRTLTASGVGVETEVLREVIQTDAAINPGNSGGPLINLRGQVVGVNVAKAAGADNIGFAIPINRIKNSIEQAESTGNVKYPFLGVRYILITPPMAEENNLPYDYGALIVRGSNPGQVAVQPGSAADKAGMTENNIILEINGERITPQNTLATLINQYAPGETINLKVYQAGEESELTATLGERP